MPIVDANRLKGNAGASEVAARLSGHCLVRPVAADTDVGIDMYCETVEKSQPFLHFWLQVKAGAQCRVTPDGAWASCRFHIDQLDYWARQPVPVFAALVPPSPRGQVPSVYLVGISEQLLDEPVSGANTRLLASQWIWRPGNETDVRAFLDVVVPRTTALMKFRDGVVGTVPSLGETYFKQYPYGPVARFSEEILTQIRRTAALSILSLRERGEYSDETAPLRRRLERVAAQFADDDHWETFAARAFSLHLDGEYEAAVACYDRAISVIRADPNTRGSSAWTARIHHLEKEKGQASDRVDLERDCPTER